MKMDFPNWTEYDEWLKENCELYNITIIDQDEDGIHVTMEKK